MPPDADSDGGFPPEDVQQRMADAIMRGEDLNVIEIDGASNNSVDQARQLIANAGLTPTDNALLKVYIIDEVHMLSMHAFNALLKTMEEPPPHVKFILCTTEPHKVPVTIQSRCQRFDFRNIATGRIADHLRDVLQREKVTADDRLLWQIARLGNGSMRDALTLLDRLIATAEPGQKLSEKMLEQMLGLPAQDMLTALVDALAAGDLAAALGHTAGLLDRGIAQDQLIDSLIDWLRQLMLLAACGADTELVELSDDARARAVEQAARFDSSGLVHMIALCENLQRLSKASANPRALLDATIVRLALAEKMADVAALLDGTASRQAAPAAASASAPAAHEKKKPPIADAPDPQPMMRPREGEAPAEPTFAPRPEAVASSMPPPGSVAAPQPPPSESLALPTRATVGPQRVWQDLLDRVADRASLGWVRSFTLQRLDERTAYIDTLPGQRDMRKFLSDRTRSQLASLFESVLGRAVRVELDVPATPSPAAPASAPPARGDPVDANQRRHALALPLVRQVIETFDATVVDVRTAAEGSADRDGEGD